METTERFMPSIDAVKAELERLRREKHNRKVMAGVLCFLLLLALTAVFFGVGSKRTLAIDTDGMEPTLSRGEYVLFRPGKSYHRGDVICFAYGDLHVVKRVAATAGEWVDIQEDGTVLVNGQALEEAYLPEKSRGDVTVELPLQVPDHCYFVLGDSRDRGVDSRSRQIGLVEQEQVIGKAVLRLWPLGKLGKIS